jgi:hypothetical protein
MIGQGAQHVIKVTSGDTYRLDANKLDAVEQVLVFGIPFGEVRGRRSRASVDNALKLANGVEEVMVRSLPCLESGLVSVCYRLLCLSPTLGKSHATLQTGSAIASYASYGSRKNNC